MKEKIFRILFTLVLVLSSSLFTLWPMARPVRAATITSTAAGGAWATGSTWVGGVAPLATDSVVIATTGTNTVTTAGNRTCAGLTINSGATLSMASGNVLTVNGDVSGTGTWTTGGGTRTISLTGNWSFSGTSTGNGATVVFTGSGNQTLSGRITTGNGALTINKSGGSVTLGNAITVGTFTMTAGTFDAGTYLLTTTATLTAGTLRVGTATWAGNYSFTPTPPAGFTIEYYNANPTINAGITYQNLAFSGTGTASASGALTIQGNLTNTGGGTLNFAARNVTISGTVAAINIAGFTTTGTLSCTKTSGTATLTGNVSSGPLSKSGAGTLNLGTGLTHTCTNLTASAGTLNGGSSTLNISGTVTTGGTFTAGTSTINYSGAAQTVGAWTYYNLTLSGSGTKTLAGVTTVGNNLTINTGTTLDVSANNYGLTVSGNWNNGGAFTQRSGTVTLNGTSAQTMTGVTTFYNLTLNNNGLALNNNATVSNTLTLTNGKITTGSNTVIVSSSGSVSRTNGYVIGNLQKSVSTGSNVSQTFEVGTASAYDPVAVTFASVTVAGNLTAKATLNDHPSIGTSLLDPSKSVNAYWTLTNSGITFTNYNAIFTFTSGDIDSGANTSNFIIGNFNNPNWTYPTVGTRTSTTTQATGITSFGDFAVAEAKTLALSVNISGTTIICQGTSTMLTANASGGTSPYTYLWSTGATTTSIDVTVAGTYSVTVTDSTNATASNSVTITVNTAPIVTLSGNPNICGTGSTTLITANVSGGSPDYSYDWSPCTATGTPSGNTFTANGAGTVAVTVTDSLGCKGRAKTIVSVKSPPSVIINGITSICEGNSSTLTATPSGGTPPYTYLWSTGATTPSINVSFGGTYSVTVTDSAACTGVIVSDTNTQVTQGNVQGASYPYSAAYAWVHGSWWSSLTGYTFDWSNGHTNTAAQWIWESYRPVHPVDGDIVYFQRSFTIPGTPTGANVYITCDNGYEVSINGHFLGSAQLLPGWGTGHLTDPYVPPSGWQTVETWTVPADWLISGTNTLNITGVNEQSDGGTVDGNPGGIVYELVYQTISDCGCTATDSKTVTVNPSPVATASSNSPVAQGGTIMLYGGPDGMSLYSWIGPNSFSSPFQNPTIPSATGANAGTYTLTVTSPNNCSDNVSVDVTVTAPPTVDAIEIYTDQGCTNTAFSMTPQTPYYAKVSITSNSNLSYLQTVQVTMFYNDGSHPDAPITANTQSCAILTCNVGPPTAWTIEPSNDIIHPNNTTWQLLDTSCSQPADLDVQTGYWVFAFKPGKVATESTTPARWDAQGKTINKNSQTGNLYVRNKAMNWYGEITITDPPDKVDWGEVPLGLKFEDTPNPKSVSINYVANGDYFEDVMSSENWTGAGQNVTLDYQGRNQPPSGLFSLKADNTLNYNTSNIVSSTQYVHINAGGTQTTEAGVPVNTNGLWLSLSLEDILPITYSGAIYYQISDR
jgi:hypothetical protein